MSLKHHAPRALPIVVLDERALRPRFGYVFNVRWLGPHESIVSMLWTFARMNMLTGHAVVTRLRRDDIDPYAGIEPTPADVDVARVAQLLDIAPEAVRLGLRRPGPGVNRHFRFCRRCLARGYHSAIHQLEHHLQCPAHGRWLETACPHCGQHSDYRLDAQLLDAPFRCRHCRRYYARGAADHPDERRGFTLKHRLALTRAAWLEWRTML